MNIAEFTGKVSSKVDDLSNSVADKIPENLKTAANAVAEPIKDMYVTIFGKKHNIGGKDGITIEAMKQYLYKSDRLQQGIDWIKNFKQKMDEWESKSELRKEQRKKARQEWGQEITTTVKKDFKDDMKSVLYGRDLQTINKISGSKLHFRGLIPMAKDFTPTILKGFAVGTGVFMGILYIPDVVKGSRKISQKMISSVTPETKIKSVPFLKRFANSKWLSKAKMEVLNQ